MCNLYSIKPSAAEVRGLLEHYKLAGQNWSELFESEQATMNESGLAFPKYPAPVVTVRNGIETLETRRWGMPGPLF